MSRVGRVFDPEAWDVRAWPGKQTRQLHMPLEQSQVLIVLGQVAAAVGDRAAATHYFEDAGTLGRASGFMHSLAWSMYEAAKVYRDEGRYADAERCETQAMNAMHQVADEYHLPLHLAVLADLQAKEGNLLKAQETLWSKLKMSPRAFS